MGNPWMDDVKAHAWMPTGKPGQVLREDALAVAMRLIDVQAPTSLVDLGCGIGDVATRLLERFPAAHLTAIDGAPGMLERTRDVLAPFGPRAAVLGHDLREPWEEAIETPDVVFASQVVHHLDGPAKRDLFARVHGVLTPGGLFVLIDKVRFDPRFHAHQVALWNDLRRRGGFDPIPPEQTAEAYLAAEAQGGDVPDALCAQLAWLGEAGFAAAESFWQHGDKAVLAALKAPVQGA